jgi:hypothetical protein
MRELIKEKHRWVLRLSEAAQRTLEEGARHHPRADARERCAALLKVAAGHCPPWVATQGLLVWRDPDSVYQWLHYDQDEGIVGLLAHRHGGHERRRL